MKRTTVFLPEALHERLRTEAFSARVSMAELIRTRLENGNMRLRQAAAASRDPLSKVIGVIRDGSLAQGIDEELYHSE
jgi:hypothetical protein